MKQLVIMPGGFHPFHAGHAALYNSAVKAFPGADVYVAATNDTSTRPFPFAVKEKLAQLAGVAPRRFVQVKSPFKAEEIVHQYDPNNTQLIFVRSEKDEGSQPRPGGVKKDGSPSYLQPYNDASDQPLSQQAYMAYLPTVEFGPGMTSATEIRGAWPRLNEKRKTALVMSLYPRTQSNPKLAATVVKLLDTAMGSELNEFSAQNLVGGMKASYQQRENQPVAEGDVVPFKQPSKTLTWQQVPRNILLLANDWFWASEDNSGLDATIDPEGYGNGTANDVRYAAAKLQQQGWTIDFNDEYDGPGEFNLRLTNKRGQTVLLSIEDAQDFTGWAQGTNQGLNEFAPAGGDDGDEKSYLLQLADDLGNAMYGPNKNKKEIEHIVGKIRAAGGDVKISWNNDSTMNVVMYHPVHFKQGYLIRLVGRGDSGVTENQGWAATYENTAPNPRVDLTPNFPNYAKLIGEFIGVKKNRALFQIIAAELRPGQGETEKIFRAMSTNTPIGIEIGKVKNRSVVEDAGKEFVLYINGKPAAKYVDQQQALLDMAAVRKKYPTARLELKHEVCSMQTVKQVNEGSSILEVLKPDSFAALQQAKQNIEQNRQQEIDQWAQDFRANSAKLAGQQLKRAVAPPPVPVAQPGEKHAVLKNRIAQLDLAIKKQQQLDALTQKLEYKGLLTPAMQQDFDTRMYVRDAAADNYQALNQKLDRALEIATNRLRTNKLAFRENADYIEEARKI